MSDLKNVQPLADFNWDEFENGGSVNVNKAELEKAYDETLNKVSEQQVVEGKVISIDKKEVVVNIGYKSDGIIPASEFRYNPDLKVGDTVEVTIKKLDDENKKISLGFKKLEDNPWEILKRDYPVGTVVDAKIVGLAAFGAFANVIPGIDGLIHISQISWDRVKTPGDVLKVGDEVKCEITDIDFDKKRVSLSMKTLLPKPEEGIPALSDQD